MRQVFFAFLLAASGLASPSFATPRQTTLTVTYFNMEWFGLGGSPSGTTASETRAPTVKKFFDDNALWADVMSFEEIVDLNRLQHDVLQDRYKCQSYVNRDAKHQHVALCYKNAYTLVKAADDDNFTLENVAMTNLRPAVHGILKNAQGQRLAQFFSVHLKAMPDKGDVRRQQVQMIADYINGRADAEPVVVLGDFNTFDNEPAEFDDIFGSDLKQVALHEQYTWREPTRGSKFDRAWVSSEMGTSVTERVLGACNLPASSAAAISTYNRTISDHCPVNLTLHLPNP